MSNVIQSNQVENMIVTIRGERVLLDSDVAKLYGVETREINQAVKNNLDKFHKSLHRKRALYACDNPKKPQGYADYYSNR